jgi:hypothetical protein
MSIARRRELAGSVGESPLAARAGVQALRERLGEAVGQRLAMIAL